MDLHASLKAFKPQKAYFTGIDSDGCVFDSMEVKQKEFFIPLALKHFGLFAISGVLRRTWEYVNLYSVNRGGNRFISLIKVMELLSSNDQVRTAGVELPDMSALKNWVKKENKLANETLRKYLEANPDPGLEKISLWSEDVNREINAWLRNIPPFPHVRESLERISMHSDIMVVSQTPFEAIDREWKEHDLARFADFIAGQEHGTKTEHLALGAIGKYHTDKILMIGDAKGDMEAAFNNEVLFFPIIPGKEDQSWIELLNEGLKRFIEGSFRGEFQDYLTGKFLDSLKG
jgi:phosphoglycolate phosphatase-like HAD superfamily hydrolase